MYMTFELVDKSSYEYLIGTLLEYNSEIVKIAQMTDWIEENLPEANIRQYGVDGTFHDFTFYSPEDAMAFKLAWC